jgi:hypothetical protein
MFILRREVFVEGLLGSVRVLLDVLRPTFDFLYHFGNLLTFEFIVLLDGPSPYESGVYGRSRPPDDAGGYGRRRPDESGAYDSGKNQSRRPPRKDRDERVREAIIEERINRERPCRVLFIRNIKASRV